MGKEEKEPQEGSAGDDPEPKRRRVQSRTLQPGEGPAPRGNEPLRRTRQYTRRIGQGLVGPTMLNLSILFHIVQILGFVYVPTQPTRMHGAMSLGCPEDWLHRIHLGLRLALVCRTWYVAIMGQGLLTTADLHALGFADDVQTFGDHLQWGNVPSEGRIWETLRGTWQRSLGHGLMPIHYLQSGYAWLTMYRNGIEHVPRATLSLLPQRLAEKDNDCSYVDLCELWMSRTMNMLSQVRDDYEHAAQQARIRIYSDNDYNQGTQLLNAIMPTYETALRLRMDLYRLAFRVFGGYVCGMIFMIVGAHLRSVEEQKLVQEGLDRLSVDFRNVGSYNPMFGEWIQYALIQVREYVSRIARKTQHAVYAAMQRGLILMGPCVHPSRPFYTMQQPAARVSSIDALFPDYHRDPLLVHCDQLNPAPLNGDWFLAQIEHIMGEGGPRVIPHYNLWRHDWRYDMIQELIQNAIVVANAGRLCAFNDIGDRTGFHAVVSEESARALWVLTMNDAVVSALETQGPVDGDSVPPVSQDEAGMDSGEAEENP
tara:strand:- start:18413 stop:20029 length:1617 start_codon:yes stop_codon:yes gene_type:complete